MAQQRIGRSPRRKEPQSRSAYWRSQSEAWLRSGLTQADFCEEQGLSVSAFRWWRWKLKKEDSASAAPPVLAKDKSQGMRLVPVRVVDPESSPPCSAVGESSAFEVILDRVTRIRVPRDFDADALSRLVRTLEAVGC